MTGLNRTDWVGQIMSNILVGQITYYILLKQLMFNSFPGETATSEGREKCGQINECAMDCKNATDFTVPSPKA